MIENGFAHLPERALWLSDMFNELMSFPKSKHDDQADSISHSLDWIKQRTIGYYDGMVKICKQEAERIRQSCPG